MLFIKLTLNMYHYKGYTLFAFSTRQKNLLWHFLSIHLYLEHQKTTFQTDLNEAQFSTQGVKYHRKTTLKNCKHLAAKVIPYKHRICFLYFCAIVFFNQNEKF